MNLIDTHSHIYSEEFDADRPEVVSRAEKAGVTKILLPAIDSQSHERLFGLCGTYPDVCVPMMGLHPTSVNDNPHWRKELDLVAQYLEKPPVEAFCAVGEIGLDFYWSRDFMTEQIEAFRRQIEWALDYKLPIAVHVRDAWPQTIALIQEYAGCGLRGVFHAYSDSVESYHTLKECGDFVFGIGGVVTFRKSTLAAVVRQMELADMVLETDSPYLTPTPHRGERNEPSYVKFVCDKVAEIKDVMPHEVATITFANASRIFGLATMEKQ